MFTRESCRGLVEEQSIHRKLYQQTSTSRPIDIIADPDVSSLRTPLATGVRAFLFHQSIMHRKAAAGSKKAANPPPAPPLCGHCQQPSQPGKSLLVCSSCPTAAPSTKLRLGFITKSSASRGRKRRRRRRKRRRGKRTMQLSTTCC